LAHKIKYESAETENEITNAWEICFFSQTPYAFACDIRPVKFVTTRHSALNLKSEYKEVSPEGENTPRCDRYSKKLINKNATNPMNGNQ
jgi:hypothetical protein